MNILLEANHCRADTATQIATAVEEIFINIANYAYSPANGSATVKCTVRQTPLSIAIEFRDSGKPCNPLRTKAPDLTLPLEKRPVGGLGIHIVRNTMDSVRYRHADGQNILTIRKQLMT